MHKRMLLLAQNSKRRSGLGKRLALAMRFQPRALTISSADWERNARLYPHPALLWYRRCPAADPQLTAGARVHADGHRPRRTVLRAGLQNKPLVVDRNVIIAVGVAARRQRSVQAVSIVGIVLGKRRIDFVR